MLGPCISHVSVPVSAQSARQEMHVIRLALHQQLLLRCQKVFASITEAVLEGRMTPEMSN